MVTLRVLRFPTMAHCAAYTHETTEQPPYYSHTLHSKEHYVRLIVNVTMSLGKVVLFLLLANICLAFRILLVFPMPTRSHATLGEGYVNRLLDAGHEVCFCCKKIILYRSYCYTG